MEPLKALFCGVLAIIVAGCGAGSSARRELPQAANVEPAKFVITASDGENTSHTVLYLVSHYALEASAPNEPIQAIYDLQEMSWTLPPTGEKTTFEECRAWESKAVEKLRKTQSQVTDAKSRTFLDRTIDPQLTAEKEAATLTIKNEFVTYTVRGGPPAPEPVMANFFRYDKLNTYRKCMRDQLLPPFVGIQASELMWQHGILPAEITMKISQPNGQQFAIGVSIQQETITGEEKKFLEKAIADAGTTAGAPTPQSAAPRADRARMEAQSPTGRAWRRTSHRASKIPPNSANVGEPVGVLRKHDYLLSQNCRSLHGPGGGPATRVVLRCGGSANFKHPQDLLPRIRRAPPPGTCRRHLPTPAAPALDGVRLPRSGCVARLQNCVGSPRSAPLSTRRGRLRCGPTRGSAGQNSSRHSSTPLSAPVRLAALNGPLRFERSW